MLYLTPVIAVVLTMLIGAIIFTLIGYDGFARRARDLHHAADQSVKMAGPRRSRRRR